LHVQVAGSLSRAGGSGSLRANGSSPVRLKRRRGGPGSSGDADQELDRAAAAAELVRELEGTLDRL
jgi:hypothetical protein